MTSQQTTRKQKQALTLDTISVLSGSVKTVRGLSPLPSLYEPPRIYDRATVVPSEDYEDFFVLCDRYAPTAETAAVALIAECEELTGIKIAPVSVSRQGYKTGDYEDEFVACTEDDPDLDSLWWHFSHLALGSLAELGSLATAYEQALTRPPIS